MCREIKRGGKIAGFDTVFTGAMYLWARRCLRQQRWRVPSPSLSMTSSLSASLSGTWRRSGQATEHNYCGVKCGIMDQFASVFGKAGKLLRLDCKSFSTKSTPSILKGYCLLLVDSCVKHRLASSAYNKRRESCENVVAVLAKRYPRDQSSSAMLPSLSSKR